MHRIDHPTAVSEKPAPQPVGTPGFFDGGDALAGRDATWMTHDWANDMQENVCEVIEAAGIALSKGDGMQLLAAIRSLSVQGGIPMGVPVPYVGTLNTVPANFVPVMGQTLQRDLYPEIAAFALSSGVLVSDDQWLTQPLHRTKFSSGDGQTTIRLPDLRSELIYGADVGRGVRSAAIGDWLDGDLKPHTHNAVTDDQGDHVHNASTDSKGVHNHGGSTGQAGGHNHAPDGFSRLLKPPYAGSITGSDTTNSGSEQAVGQGDSADIVAAPDHQHPISGDGLHDHVVAVASSGLHRHTVLVSPTGGIETRQRGTNYIYIMRVR